MQRLPTGPSTGREARPGDLCGGTATPRSRMPWISDDIEDWDELSEEEQSAIRTLLEELGVECPDEEDEDYYE